MVKKMLVYSLMAGLGMIGLSLSWLAIDTYFNKDYEIYDSLLISGMALILDAICFFGAIHLHQDLKHD